MDSQRANLQRTQQDNPPCNRQDNLLIDHLASRPDNHPENLQANPRDSLLASPQDNHPVSQHLTRQLPRPPQRVNQLVNRLSNQRLSLLAGPRGNQLASRRHSPRHSRQCSQLYVPPLSQRSSLQGSQPVCLAANPVFVLLKIPPCSQQVNRPSGPLIGHLVFPLDNHHRVQRVDHLVDRVASLLGDRQDSQVDSLQHNQQFSHPDYPRLIQVLSQLLFLLEFHRHNRPHNQPLQQPNQLEHLLENPPSDRSWSLALSHPPNLQCIQLDSRHLYLLGNPH